MGAYNVAELQLEKFCHELRAEIEVVVSRSIQLAKRQMSDPKSATYLTIAEDMLDQIGKRIDQTLLQKGVVCPRST